MALSEEERRQWDGIERLLAEDPVLTHVLQERRFRYQASGTTLALAVVLVAFAIVLLAVIVKIPLIGVVGFVLMIMGGTRFLRSKRKDKILPRWDRASRDAS